MQQGSKIGNWLTKWFNLLIKQEQAEVFSALESTKNPLPQAPNRQETWSNSQNPRSAAMTGPRFVQKDMSMQPAPKAGIELAAQQPIIFSKNNKAVCNGKIEPNEQIPGHPRIFINLDNAAEYSACGYCGQRFQLESEQNKSQ
jgi:NADH dehydrogenase (ubiquinone) Fe-S protein 6